MRALALVALAPLFSCATPIRDAEARAVLAAQAECWNRGDLRGFVATYAPDTTFLGERGLVRGATDLLAKYERAYPTAKERGTLTFELLEVRPVGGDAALALGEYRLARAEPDHGFFSLLLRRDATGVRIAHDHTTQAKPHP